MKIQCGIHNTKTSKVCGKCRNEKNQNEKEKRKCYDDGKCILFAIEFFGS